MHYNIHRENTMDETFGLNETDLGNLKLLFAHPGWEVLSKQLKDNLEALNDISRIESNDQLWFHRGQCAVLSNVMNLPDIFEMVEEAEKDSAGPVLN
jgi:hypothetical protein